LKNGENPKMVRIWLFFVMALFVFGACVPAKKLVYLQNKDLKNRKDIPRDSVLRTHQLSINEYRIQPLDILSVTFETLNDENDAFDFLSKLSPQRRSGGGNIQSAGSLMGVMVNADGDLEYAVLGKIRVTGLTIFEAEDTIRAVASKYISDVIVRVRMLNFRYTVLGEVNGEKTVTVNNPRITMMEAIANAGGLTELADRTLVKVLRQNGNDTEVFYVNLLEEKFIESDYYYVQQNDVIIVPPLRQRTFKRYFTSNLGLITSSISFILFVITLSNR
jgi:polysaccharide biosynthesis/export protein